MRTTKAEIAIFSIVFILLVGAVIRHNLNSPKPTPEPTVKYWQDPETKCQYFTDIYNTVVAPRLNVDGKPLCGEVKKNEVH